MRGVQSIDFDPINVNVVGVANEVVIAADADGTTTLDLAITPLAAAPGVGRQITFEDESAGGDNPNLVITFVGTDADGRPQQESITDIEDNGAIKTTTKYYNTVDEIFVGTDVEFELTINIGTNGVMVSKALMLDKYAVNSPLVVMEETGTLAWEIETTTEILDSTKNQGDVVWTNDPSAESVTASQQDNLQDWPVAYMRLITSSYTDTGEIAVRVSQGY
jgi:hypothetical protein